MHFHIVFQPGQMLDGYSSHENEDSIYNVLVPALNTNLMKLNSCLQKVKEVDLNTKKMIENATINQFISYSITDEITTAPRNENRSIQNNIVTEPLQLESGYVGELYVTNIVDQLGGICYIIDANSMPNTEMLFGLKPKLLKRLPKPDEIFGYFYLDKCMFRARRDTDGIIVNGQFKAVLIDIGCKIDINIENNLHHFFEVTDNGKHLSSFARKCQVFLLPENLSLDNLLHQRVCYKVLCVENGSNMVYINILEFNKARGDNDSENVQFTFFSHFLIDIDILPLPSRYAEHILKHNENKIKTSVTEHSCIIDEGEQIQLSANNPFIDSFEISNKNAMAIKAQFSKKFQLCKSLNGLADGWIEKNSKFMKTNIHLQVEPKQYLVTQNTLDSRNSAFTPSNSSSEENTLIDSKKELTHINFIDHDPEQDSRNTRPSSVTTEAFEKESNISVDIPLPSFIIEPPSIGDEIIIQPTHVENASEFYAYTKHEKIKNVEEFTEMLSMNALCWKKYDPSNAVKTPKLGEKVFVKHEETVYRGEIIATLETYLFQVNLIDYGGCLKVHINNIFYYDSTLNAYPAYAQHYRINGIKPIQEMYDHDYTVISDVEKILTVAEMKATIIDIIQSNYRITYVVDLYDENNLNTAETLTFKNLARLAE